MARFTCSSQCCLRRAKLSEGSQAMRCSRRMVLESAKTRSIPGEPLDQWSGLREQMLETSRNHEFLQGKHGFYKRNHRFYRFNEANLWWRIFGGWEPNYQQLGFDHPKWEFTHQMWWLMDGFRNHPAYDIWSIILDTENSWLVHIPIYGWEVQRIGFRHHEAKQTVFYKVSHQCYLQWGWTTNPLSTQLFWTNATE